MNSLIITNYRQITDIPVGTVIQNFESTTSSGYVGYIVYYEGRSIWVYQADAMTIEALNNKLVNLDTEILRLEQERSRLYSIVRKNKYLNRIE